MVGSVLSGMKINAAVAASRSSNGTLYTAPSNGYAILNLAANAGTAGCDITVGGILVYSFLATASAGAPQSGVSGGQVGSVTIYAGPSQAVEIVNYSGTRSIGVSGVELVNAV